MTLAFGIGISKPTFAIDDHHGAANQQASKESPVRGIKRQRPRRSEKPEFYYRSIDGSNNNFYIAGMNAAHGELRRYMTVEYADYVSQMAGIDRPNARQISNIVASQITSIENRRRASDYLWQWGQFLDHDIDLTDGSNPAELANIAIPAGDNHFDPSGSGNAELSFNRSLYSPSSGTGVDKPRQQVNEITGWIDASNVYGSDIERASALRMNDGSGRLRVSEGNFLPFNHAGFPNAGGNSNLLFLAGDVRANEQVALTAMHTLFMREHNRVAKKIRRRHSRLSGDEVYQRARRLVAAQMQIITYNEFIPTLLGKKALSRYRGYKPNADARIMNSFSTAAFRLGHSLLNSTILRVDRKGREVDAGHLPLRSAFFAPQELLDHGIEPILRGLAKQKSQNLDIYVVDDVRNFLFGEPGRGGFDLASLNIQRGRDHGLPSYNAARAQMGLAMVTSFAEISVDITVQSRLSQAYGTPEYVDLWVGGLAEDHVSGAMVGPLFLAILKQQFEALRDGDRFWYQRSLSRAEKAQLRGLRLAHIIRRNTSIGRELKNDVFHVR